MRAAGTRPRHTRAFGALLVSAAALGLALAAAPGVGRSQPVPDPATPPSVPTRASELPPTAPTSARISIEDVVPPRGPDGARPKIHPRDLNKLLDRELSIIETLEGLQFGLAKQQVELERVQKERAQVETALATFEQQFRDEEQALAAHRERVRKRLRALRRLSRMETLYLVFSSDTFTEYLRRERLLARLVIGDRDRLTAWRAALEHFRRSQEELRRRRDELAAIELTIFQAKARIQQDRSDHEELLRRVDEERSFYEKFHQELNRRSQAVAQKIDELQKWEGHGWFDGRKGKLAPPINYATVAVPYGHRVHPRFGTKVLHRGLTYAPSKVPEGRGHLDVRAIYMGKVIHAGWLSGYGNTVILDHTKGYYTVYSKLAEITVKQGEVLQSRERLGVIGKGSLRNAELYFELRVDGKPVDPQPWLRP